jgi:pyruvate formate lyase activating enzyme
MESGWITHIQRFCLHDGPGIRTTVFLKGCPLQCPWCHNPEGRSRRPERVVLEARCIRCGACAKVCPENLTAAAEAADSGVRCRLCGACVEACPTGARRIVGRRMSVKQVVREVSRDRVFFEDSGGGVTFSGGEPVMQARFLFETLEACHEAGLSTAVDTCGAVPGEDLMLIAHVTDLFLYDLKLFDRHRHTEFVGVPNTQIRVNLDILGAFHSNIWLRVPIIPGVNDRKDEWKAIARTAARNPGVRQVCLLPYHRTGAAKYRRLGLDYAMEDVEPPSSECMKAALKVFQDAGAPVRIGG